MLSFSDLRFGPPPGEEVYTWQDPDTGETRLWAVERLAKWLETGPVEHQLAKVESRWSDYYRENRGIEDHRIEWLKRNFNASITPIIILKLVGGQHITLDGHHRYVLLAELGIPFIRAYILTEEQASQFEVKDFPKPKGRLNIHAYSGIDRG